MRNDELDNLEFPPDDPTTAMLDKLDADEEFGAPDDPLPLAPPVSRRDIDVLIDEVLDGELKKFNDSKRKG
jgi:hypothetical protein